MKKAVIGLTFLFISLQFLLPLAAQVSDLYETEADEISWHRMYIDELGYLEEDGFIYRLQNGEPQLIKYIGRSEEVTIPETIGGEKISSDIGQFLFEGNPHVKEVILPEYVNILSYRMFASCPNLTDVYIYGKITGFGGNIFVNSPNITLHTLPDTSMSYTAEDANILIEYLHDPDSFLDGDFICKKNQWDESAVDIIADKNVTVPSKVKDMSVISIFGNGFSGNSSIVSVTVPDSVKTLYYHTFYNCPNLTEVIIEGTGTKAQKNPFGDKKNEDLVIYVKRGSSMERSIKEIGLKFKYIKLNPDSISSGDFEYIILNDGNISIAGYMGTNIEELIIPETLDDKLVVGIEDKAFEGYDIKKFVLPDTITFIGNSAFLFCQVQEINFPESLEYIGDQAFNISPLKKVVLPDRLEIIGDGAFAGCSQLTEVQFGQYLRRIGNSAFAICWGLTEIKLPDGLEIIGDSAFFLCNNITDIYMPDSVTEIGSEIFSQMTKLKAIKLSSGLKSIPTYAFYGCWALKEIDIPEGVTTLGYRAFMHSYGLERIVLPSTLREVNPQAFENDDMYPFSNLREIVIPSMVYDNYDTLIKPYCPNIENIILL